MTSPEPADTPAADETPAESKKLRAVGKHVAVVAAREHPTLILTLAYLALTFVGMIHDLWFYFYFRINILDFSETSDFLLAAFRNPLVILLAILPIGILMAFQQARWYDNYQRKYANTRWNTVFWRMTTSISFVIIYAIAFTQIYAKREADRIKNGTGRRVSYIRNDGIRTDEAPILLGTTGRFLLFYYPSTKTTEIVPIEATTALRVDSRRRREREQDSLVFPDSLAIPDTTQ